MAGPQTQYHMHSAIQPPASHLDVNSDNISGIGGVGVLGGARAPNFSRISSYLPHNIIIEASQA